MKRAVAGILFCVLGLSLACARKGNDMTPEAPSSPKITREYLLAHGFKQSADGPAAFIREHAPLRDVLHDLNIPLKSLRPMVNQPDHSDERTAVVDGIGVNFRSEVRDKDGNVIDRSLDKADAICTVEVWFQSPKREYLKTDSTPRLRIKSVDVPDDHTKPLMVTFELAATGKKPVAISQRDFDIDLTGGDIPPYTGFGFLFPKGTPEIIVISPAKPVVFTLSVLMNTIPTHRLSSGEYALLVRIGSFKSREPQCFDYEWEGAELSRGA
jgi:hypothetical protein